MVYASFDEASSDERFDAVLNRLFVRSGEFAVSADLVESLVVDVLAGSALQAEYGLPVAESTSDELLASGHERDDGLVLRLGLVRLLLLLRFGSGLPAGPAACVCLRFAAASCGAASAAQFLRVHVAVGHVRAVAAVVTMLPVLILSEIVEEHAAQAFVRLAVLLHRVESAERGAFGLFLELGIVQRAACMVLQAVPPS